MAVTVSNIIPRKQLANGFETQYTAINKTTVIDKLTLTNTDADIRIVSIFLVADGGSPGNENCILLDKTIAINETYTCPEAIGQVVQDSDSIRTYCDSSSAVTISASGREIT